VTGPSSLTKENIFNREKGQKWVEMSEGDVRVLKRNILSSLQQCEEALNKCIVEVSICDSFCAVLCRAVLGFTVMYCAVLCCTALCCTALCRGVLCCLRRFLCCTVLFCTVLYSTALCCTVLH
jgi:hypothetical protein